MTPLFMGLYLLTKPNPTKKSLTTKRKSHNVLWLVMLAFMCFFVWFWAGDGGTPVDALGELRPNTNDGHGECLYTQVFGNH